MRNLIFGLARPLLRMLGRDDRGAIGVLVAVLIGGGVLLGMGAMVIDVGRLYQNRAELQNGADAGALAVAKACVQATANCTTANAQSLAGGYASQNASQLTGDTAGVDQPCGYGGPGAGLGGCTGGTGALYSCPQDPVGVNYVDVNTHTQLPGNSTLLPPVFAELLLGKSGYAGSEVKACAQAEWGPATSASTLGFTVSACQWSSQTSGGSSFGTEVALLIKGNAKPCAGPGGQNMPGGFGWLSPDSNCMVAVDLTSNSTLSDPGNNVPPPCKTVIQQDAASATTVFIPVFDSTGGNGSKATYHLVGLSAFVLNGYQNLPGVHPDLVPAGMSGSCGNSPCLFGQFTQGLVPLTNSIGGGTDYGASAIKLTG